MSVVQNLLPRVNAFMEIGRCSTSNVAMLVTSLAGECWGLYNGSQENEVYLIFPNLFQTYRWMIHSGEVSLFKVCVYFGVNAFTYIAPRTQENRRLHQFCCALGRSVDVVVKTINTLAVALSFKKRFGAPAAVITGIATGALSAYNVYLSWHNMPKIRGDKIQ